MARNPQVVRPGAEATWQELVEYWSGVMKDKRAKESRRDRAAKELFKIASISARMVNSKKRMKSLEKRAVILARKKKLRDFGSGGKKNARKEHAAETAHKSSWSGLVPKADVLPFAKRK